MLKTIDFDDPDLLTWLEGASDAALDAADFGIIAMDRDGTVVAYNSCESRISGLSRERTLGRDFFNDVAPCTNNFMVAGRYDETDELDETIRYVFTLRMSPRRVRLRLLKAPASRRQYLVVDTVS